VLKNAFFSVENLGRGTKPHLVGVEEIGPGRMKKKNSRGEGKLSRFDMSAFKEYTEKTLTHVDFNDVYSVFSVAVRSVQSYRDFNEVMEILRSYSHTLESELLVARIFRKIPVRDKFLADFLIHYFNHTANVMQNERETDYVYNIYNNYKYNRRFRELSYYIIDYYYDMKSYKRVDIIFRNICENGYNKRSTDEPIRVSYAYRIKSRNVKMNYIKLCCQFSLENNGEMY
jgi:hypothetical protein